MTKHKFEIDLELMKTMDAPRAIAYFEECEKRHEKARKGLKYDQVDHDSSWAIQETASSIITQKRFEGGLMPEAEIKFRENYKEKLAEMELHIKAASVEVQKAIAISKEYAIPFSAWISPLRNFYTPQSAIDLMKDEKSDLSDFEEFENISEWSGWEHSAVC